MCARTARGGRRDLDRLARGGFLIAGGIAYVLGSFLALSPSLAASGIPDGVASLAMPGELWTMFALLVVGVRTRQPGSPEPEDHRAT